MDGSPGSDSATTASTTTVSDDLARRFGFWTGLWVVVASMVGSGVLITSGTMIRDLQNHQVILALWALGGILALAGAVTLAELSTALPRAGGEYVFVRVAFGPAWGFVYGASTLLLGFATPVALVAYTAVSYATAPVDPSAYLSLMRLAGLAGSEAVPAEELLRFRQLFDYGLASLVIVFFTWTHCLGQKESAGVQAATTIFKAATLALLPLLGLTFGAGDWSHFTGGAPIAEQSLSLAAVALVSVSYSYIGWNGAVYLAGEIDDPPRNLPRTLIGGTLLVTLLYVAMNAAYAFALAPTDLVGKADKEVEAVAALAVDRLFGPRLSAYFSVLVGLGVLATVSAFILTGPRVAYAMARDGLFPEFFGRLHAERQTPVAATIAQGVVALVLLWSGKASDLLNFAGVGLSLISSVSLVAVFWMRRRPDYQPTYRMPFYPLPPIVFTVLTLAMVGLTLKDPKAVVTSLASIASIAAGFPLYYVLRAFRRTKPP
ncbi:MAG: APC family permease, partial [Planctomycetia bacterium]